MQARRFFPILLVCAAYTTAQAIIPTSSSAEFPGCALSCAVLLQAQASCIPPSVAQTTQLTYDNCFCQSSALQPIYGTPDGVCTAECTIEADRELLRSWFTGFCAQVGQGIDPVKATATANPTATGTNQQATTTITLTGRPNPDSSASHISGWFSGHWKWVVMIIVLFISFILIAILGVCLKRRYKRKHQEKTARMSGFAVTTDDGTVKTSGATPDLWGPHQHMEATQGYQYNRAAGVPRGGALGSSTSKGSRRHSRSKKRSAADVNEITEIKEDVGSKSKQSRPRPQDLDVDLRAAELQRTRSEKQ